MGLWHRVTGRPDKPLSQVYACASFGSTLEISGTGHRCGSPVEIGERAPFNFRVMFHPGKIAGSLEVRRS